MSIYDERESLRARIRSLQESTNVLRADRNNLYEALRAIAQADPSKWDSDVRDQFREWAQNIGRNALARIDKRTW